VHGHGSGSRAVSGRPPQERRDRCAAAASVAALAGDARPVAAEDLSSALGLLDEQRANLVAHRTRLINQLHALLRDLAPGRADTDLTAARAAKVLLTVRPAGPVETIRKQMARDLVGDVRAVDIRLKNLTRLIADTVAAHGTRLPEVAGIGPVVSARLLGRTGRASRFRLPWRSRTMPVSHPSRWPAGIAPGTDCLAVVIGSSTMPCTSLRSARSGCAPA
jgi:transposase